MRDAALGAPRRTLRTVAGMIAPPPGHPGFTPPSAFEGVAVADIAATACAEAGRSVGRLRWLVSGTCAVTTDGVTVVRLAADADDARRMVAVATALAGHGLAVPPADQDVRMIDGWAVTVFDHVTPSRPADWGDVAVLLRRLHDLPPATVTAHVDVPAHHGLSSTTVARIARYADRVDAAADVVAILRDAARILTAAGDIASPGVLLHCDARPANVLVGPDGPRFIDWDGTRVGPASFDLTNAARAVHSEPEDPRDGRCDPGVFAAGYGSSPTDIDPRTIVSRELGHAGWLASMRQDADRAAALGDVAERLVVATRRLAATVDIPTDDRG